nr:PREDICTED: uncharacterized protein LOC109033453 [Bemisia tabaci]
MSPVIILTAVSFIMIGPTSCTYREPRPTNMKECQEKICKEKGGLIINGKHNLPIMIVQKEMDEEALECGCRINPEVYDFLKKGRYNIDEFNLSVFGSVAGIHKWLKDNKIEFIPNTANHIE